MLWSHPLCIWPVHHNICTGSLNAMKSPTMYLTCTSQHPHWLTECYEVTHYVFDLYITTSAQHNAMLTECYEVTHYVFDLYITTSALAYWMLWSHPLCIWPVHHNIRTGLLNAMKSPTMYLTCTSQHLHRLTECYEVTHYVFDLYITTSAQAYWMLWSHPLCIWPVHHNICTGSLNAMKSSTMYLTCTSQHLNRLTECYEVIHYVFDLYITTSAQAYWMLWSHPLCIWPVHHNICTGSLNAMKSSTMYLTCTSQHLHWLTECYEVTHYVFDLYITTSAQAHWMLWSHPLCIWPVHHNIRTGLLNAMKSSTMYLTCTSQHLHRLTECYEVIHYVFDLYITTSALAYWMLWSHPLCIWPVHHNICTGLLNAMKSPTMYLTCTSQHLHWLTECYKVTHYVFDLYITTSAQAHWMLWSHPLCIWPVHHNICTGSLNAMKSPTMYLTCTSQHLHRLTECYEVTHYVFDLYITTSAQAYWMLWSHPLCIWPVHHNICTGLLNAMKSPTMYLTCTSQHPHRLTECYEVTHYVFDLYITTSAQAYWMLWSHHYVFDLYITTSAQAYWMLWSHPLCIWPVHHNICTGLLNAMKSMLWSHPLCIWPVHPLCIWPVHHNICTGLLNAMKSPTMYLTCTSQHPHRLTECYEVIHYVFDLYITTSAQAYWMLWSHPLCIWPVHHNICTGLLNAMKSPTMYLTCTSQHLHRLTECYEVIHYVFDLYITTSAQAYWMLWSHPLCIWPVHHNICTGLLNAMKSPTMYLTCTSQHLHRLTECYEVTHYVFDLYITTSAQAYWMLWSHPLCIWPVHHNICTGLLNAMKSPTMYLTCTSQHPHWLTECYEVTHYVFDLYITTSAQAYWMLWSHPLCIWPVHHNICTGLLNAMKSPTMYLTCTSQHPHRLTECYEVTHYVFDLYITTSAQHRKSLLNHTSAMC